VLEARKNEALTLIAHLGHPATIEKSEWDRVSGFI
jgi:hypothetical protein